MPNEQEITQALDEKVQNLQRENQQLRFRRAVLGTLLWLKEHHKIDLPTGIEYRVEEQVAAFLESNGL